MLVKAEILDALSANARVYHAEILECDLPYVPQSSADSCQRTAGSVLLRGQIATQK